MIPNGLPHWWEKAELYATDRKDFLYARYQYNDHQYGSIFVNCIASVRLEEYRLPGNPDFEKMWYRDIYKTGKAFKLD